MVFWRFPRKVNQLKSWWVVVAYWHLPGKSRQIHTYHWTWISRKKSVLIPACIPDENQKPSEGQRLELQRKIFPPSLLSLCSSLSLPLCPLSALNTDFGVHMKNYSHKNYLVFHLVECRVMIRSAMIQCVWLTVQLDAHCEQEDVASSL